MDNYTLVRTVEPDTEPVTTAEAKMHLRVDGSADDTYIAGLITAARQSLEYWMRRAFVTQTWRLSLSRWPDDDAIELPKPPLQSVTGITYRDCAGDTHTWAATEYDVDTDAEPGQVVLGYGKSYPTVTLDRMNPIQITYKAGYGDGADDVPQLIRQAMLLLVAHWYENREPVAVSGAMPKQIPMAIDSLIYLMRG